MTTKRRPAAKPKGTAKVAAKPKVTPVPEGDRVDITEAARLLGVHRNTVRNRIRAGLYPSALLHDDGKGGQTWTVDRADLGTDLPPRKTRETPPLPRPESPETRDPVEVVTKALAPLMAELVTLTDRLAQAQQERADAEVARRVAEHHTGVARADVARLTAELAEARQVVPKSRRRWWGGRATPPTDPPQPV